MMGRIKRAAGSVTPQEAPVPSPSGLGRAHQLFGPELENLIDELNEALAA